LKKSFYYFLVALIFYLLISTFFPNSLFVGKFGEFLGNLNFSLFGYLSYIFPFCLFGILYLSYKNRFDAEVSIKVLGGVFLFFNLLFFQSLIAKKGVIGNLFVDTLKGYIGVIGVSLLIFTIFIWSLFLILEGKVVSFFIEFANRNKQKLVKYVKQNNKKDLNSLQNRSIDADISNIELDLNNIKNNPKEFKTIDEKKERLNEDLTNKLDFNEKEQKIDNNEKANSNDEKKCVNENKKRDNL